MLHQCEGAEPEDGDTGACKGTPVTVEVHFQCLVENTVTTTDGGSVNTLSEIAGGLGEILNLVTWLSSIGFEEP